MDIDTEDGNAENGNVTPSQMVLRETRLEGYISKLESRLMLLLLSERELLLNNIVKSKKFIRKILQNTKLNVAQVLRIIRRPDSDIHMRSMWSTIF